MYWKSFLHSSHYIFPSSALLSHPSVCSVYRVLPLTYIKSHRIKTAGQLLNTPCCSGALVCKFARLLQSADVTVSWFPWVWENLGLKTKKWKNKPIHNLQELPVNEHQRDRKESVVLIKGTLRSRWVLLIDFRKMRPVCVRCPMNHHQNFTRVSSSSRPHEASRSTLPRLQGRIQLSGCLLHPYIDFSAHLWWQVWTFPPICRCIYLPHTLPGSTHSSSHTRPCVAVSTNMILT